VALQFSEQLEPGFSKIDVLNTSGESVLAELSQIDPSNSAAMLVRVDPLADGTYVVAWRTLSTVDGHLIRGSYAFSVGAPIPAGEIAVPESALVLGPSEPILRAVLLTGTMVLVGIAVHVPLVFLPAARAARASAGDSPHLRVAWISLGLATAAQVGLFANQAAGLAANAGQDFGQALGSALALGQWGTLWIIRSILIAVVFLAVARASREVRPLQAWLPVVFLGSGVLVTISFGSHGAALLESSAAATSADILHLLAGAVWAGGLVPLLISILHVRHTFDESTRRSALSQLLARFSTTATLCVGALVITGALAAWLQVVELPRLFQTDYGWTLIAKVALVVPLLGLGVINFFWTRPRVGADWGNAAADWAPRLVAAEALLALGVVAAVGMLTSLEPSRQIPLTNSPGIQLESRAGDLDLSMDIRPGIPGINIATLTVIDDGMAVDDARVDLQFKFLDSDLGQRDLRPDLEGDGQYVAQGDFLSLVGRWQVLAIIQRPGEFDARVPFRFDVELTGSAAGGVPPPHADDVRRVWSIGLAGLGLLLMFAVLQPTVWTRRVQRGITALGFAAAAIGLALLISTPGVGQMAPGLVNPVPPDEISIDSGRRLFASHCVACHGPGGLGDGPMAAALDPPPLDLTIHVPLHADFELYEFIKAGIAGTAMPAFGEQFTVVEIWHLINFLQTLPP
jgi:copper transport protein